MNIDNMNMNIDNMDNNTNNQKIKDLSESTLYLLNVLIKKSNIKGDDNEFLHINNHLNKIRNLNNNKRTDWLKEPRVSHFTSYNKPNLSNKNMAEYIPDETNIRHKIGDNYQVGMYKDNVIISDSKKFNTPCLFALYHYNKINHSKLFNHNNAWNECEAYVNRDWVILNNLNMYD